MLLMLDLQSKSKRFYIIAKVSCPNSSSIYGVKYEVPLSTWFYCNLSLEKFFGITFTCFNCSNKAILISMRNSLKMHISPKMYNRIEEINKFSINLFYIIFSITSFSLPLKDSNVILKIFKVSYRRSIIPFTTLLKETDNCLSSKRLINRPTFTKTNWMEMLHKNLVLCKKTKIFDNHPKQSGIL